MSARLCCEHSLLRGVRSGIVLRHFRNSLRTAVALCGRYLHDLRIADAVNADF
jgi:hypothetical protein